VSTSPLRVGVEVGGTFTDLVAIEDGVIRISKVPSTPARPDEGALAAIDAAALLIDAIGDLAHGSTVALNAVLERKGAPIAFLVTKGFRDILLLQRHNRGQIYDLFYAKPEPVVGRADTFEIPERIDASGAIVNALDVDILASHLDKPLGSDRYKGVAICLLNGYANPVHEQALTDWVRAHYPDLSVTCSSDVTREFREFERATTATVAAYIQPVTDAYVSRFSDALTARDFGGRFSIMQSNGGRMPAAALARNAVSSLFSGPAAGVIGAVRQAGLAGYENLITLDMGGTSTDVCVVTDGKPDLTTETEVDGLPIRSPAIDIATVGAGGGSIIWVDDGGMLRAGPQSAGAAPGPACYGYGGANPTVTDAHVIRGSIRPESFLSGAMPLSPGAATQVFTPLAEQFNLSLEDIADSAVKLADANIMQAIQLVSTERGRDPRDYVLVPFGGAGPLHAARVAEALGIGAVVVPPNAGVLSAFGLLAADFAHHDTLTRKITVDEAAPDIVRATFDDMEIHARRAFDEFGLDTAPRFSHALDMRYAGQAFEVTARFEADELATLSATMLADRFADSHIQMFGFGGPDYGAAEIVSFRLGALAPPDVTPALTDESAENDEATAQPVGKTRIFDAGVWRGATLATRTMIRIGKGVDGPALVEDGSSTAYIPPGWRGIIDDHDNLVMEAPNNAA
jgi:N-methylhydantoinase A